MVHERKDQGKHQGKSVTIVGDRLRVGHMPPFFQLDQSMDKKVKTFSIEGFANGNFVLLTFPSIDTPVCSKQVAFFKEEKRIPIVLASMDLPFAQERWLAENGMLEGGEVTAGSDHRTGTLGISYGVLMKQPRLLSRAAFVFKGGYCKHVEYVDDSSEQIDFAAVTAAIEKS